MTSFDQSSNVVLPAGSQPGGSRIVRCVPGIIVQIALAQHIAIAACVIVCSAFVEFSSKSRRLAGSL